MTERGDIINDGTDGSGKVSAGSSSSSFSRANTDPAEAETVSGSTGGIPPASTEAGGATSDSAIEDGGADEGGGADDPTAVQDDLDELTRAVQERDEFKDLALRAKADFENYRKRADRKIGESRTAAIADVVRELLPVVDNLDRALEAAGEGAGDAFTEGIKLVHADLHSMLDRLGVVPVDPVGEQFDPNHHEAIAQAPVEGAAANTIVEVAQKGFMLGDVTVRPARVVVAA